MSKESKAGKTSTTPQIGRISDVLLSPSELEEIMGSPSKRVTDTVAAQILGVGFSTIRRWRHEGRGPAYSRIGTCIRYSVGTLLQYLDDHTVKTSDSTRQIA